VVAELENGVGGAGFLEGFTGAITEFPVRLGTSVYFVWFVVN
jgi:hypothetical protein